MTPHLPALRSTLALAAIVLSGLSACSPDPNPPTAGQKLDAAIESTQQAASDAKADIKQEARDIQHSAEQAAQSGATALSDTAITTGVKTRLATDKDLESMDIQVETHDGTVTLRGTAPNASAQRRAKDLAASVEGARAVDNQLSIR
ncbi:MAG TPA: BON domain-containing protein [Aquabacterium sp.]|uniref:BON domain-containing protein n=1 Tax=Aquabacterium sp. TaxID=1872578 RepID=UPI002E2EB741|nr:BON domain-containing protein [Aquabacterium sp.]HEX5372605.1 BON domain-containing protein [Aquabacterium sp.]